MARTSEQKRNKKWLLPCMSVSWMVCTSSRSLMSSMLARVLFAVGSAAKENFCECLPRESLAWPTMLKTAAWPRPRTTKYHENCHHGRITKPLSLSLKPSKRTTPAVHTRQKRFYSFFPLFCSGQLVSPKFETICPYIWMNVSFRSDSNYRRFNL